MVQTIFLGFTYFYSQYLVPFAMVPRNRTQGLQVTLLPGGPQVSGHSSLCIFYSKQKKTSFSYYAAVKTSAGSCLSRSDGDGKEVHHSSLCLLSELISRPFLTEAYTST